MRSWTDFRDVERRDVGTETDGDAAGDAPGDKCREVGRPAGKNRGKGEKHRRSEQHGLAPVAVAERAGDHRAGKAAREGTTIGPSHGGSAVEMEVDLEELPRAAND